MSIKIRVSAHHHWPVINQTISLTKKTLDPVDGGKGVGGSHDQHSVFFQYTTGLFEGPNRIRSEVFNHFTQHHNIKTFILKWQFVRFHIEHEQGNRELAADFLRHFSVKEIESKNSVTCFLHSCRQESITHSNVKNCERSLSGQALQDFLIADQVSPKVIPALGNLSSDIS